MLPRASYRIFLWAGGNFFFIAGETMWLIGYIVRGRVWEGDVLPPMLHAAQKLTLFDCQIYIVGNAIMSATGTATFKKSAGG